MKIIWQQLDRLEALLNPIFQALPHPLLKTQKILIAYLPFVAGIIGGITLLQVSINFVFKIIRVLLSSPELLDLRGIAITTIMLFSGILLLKSFKPLKKLQRVGWRFVFAATTLTGLLNLVTNQFGCILTLIFLYILFNIRVHYRS